MFPEINSIHTYHISDQDSCGVFCQPDGQEISVPTYEVSDPEIRAEQIPTLFSYVVENNLINSNEVFLYELVSPNLYGLCLAEEPLEFKGVVAKPILQENL